MEIATAYRNVLDYLYPNDMKSYFDRCQLFLDRRTNNRRPLKRIFAELLPDVHPNVPKPLKERKLKGLMVLVRVLSKTMRTPYRWNALRFLINIRRNRPEHFKAAIGYVAQANHLWFITRTYLQAAEIWDFFREQTEYFLTQHNRDLPQSRILFGITSPVQVTKRHAITLNELAKNTLKNIENKIRHSRKPQQSIIYGYYKIIKKEIIDIL